MQVSCLINAMENESENIYRSFAFTKDRHRNDFDKLIEKGVVLLPMLQMVKEALQRMERNSIIERVKQPTDWCAPKVLVLKKTTGKACISVHLKRLGDAMKREHYLLPTTQQTQKC